MFGESDDSELKHESLIKCEVLKVGDNSNKFYKENDTVLVKASSLRHIIYDDCPPDLFVIYNEELIFCKFKDE